MSSEPHAGSPCIVDRGDGPKISGTRITVYTVLEYLRAGRTRDWIAAFLNLSSRQVQETIDYIRDHSQEVNAEFERIQERIRRGNPPEVEKRLALNREKLKTRLAELAAEKEVDALHAADHGF